MVLARLGRGIGRVAHGIARPLARVATARAVALPGYRFASLAALAWGRLLGGRVRRIDELTVIEQLPSWAFGRGGTCVGSTFLTRTAVSPQILEHEDVHRQQWQRYGLAFIPMYFAAGLDGTRNRFEIEADLVKGGYVPNAPQTPPPTQ